MGNLIAAPKGWLAALGDIVKFAARVFGEVFGLRVFRFFGEALRQAGVLILGSTLVIWSLAFILGLQCGIEGAYFNRSVGAPAYAGVFSAWCDLREIMPYAFGYMMSAKVGTGLVAEIGASAPTRASPIQPPKLCAESASTVSPCAAAILPIAG